MTEAKPQESQPMTGEQLDPETEHIRQIEMALRMRENERRFREREMYMMAM